MMNMQDLMSKLPGMMAGEELAAAMSVYPEYDEGIRGKGRTERLMALSDLYRIYIPSPTSMEIYTRLYLALIRSLQKKCTIAEVRQKYENRKAALQQGYRGIMGGADCFTIIGASGTGKSSAIDRATALITRESLIEMDKPHTVIIPCLVVQAPFDASTKQLLLEILRKVDEMVGSNYYREAVRSRTTTTDMLIGMVSTIAINHLGILIVDEIQNVISSKNGRNLIGMLTQLINNSGISICMVGTPESTRLFGSAFQLARRSLGLQCDAMEYGDAFEGFCRTMFRYQYVQERSEPEEPVLRWLYDHSGGIVSVVVSLIHDAQEIAILTGKESLDLGTLNEAWQKRLSMLHGFIRSSGRGTQTTHRKKAVSASGLGNNKEGKIAEEGSTYSLQGLAADAKRSGADIVSLLRERMAVTEVAI